MSDLTGKVALVVGVANKRSLAWAIAQALDAAGADLVLAYQGERLKENVEELAVTLSRPADARALRRHRRRRHHRALPTRCSERFGGLDMLLHGVAFAPREALAEPFSKTSRESFRIALDISAYSLVALSNACAPLMEARGGGIHRHAVVPRGHARRSRTTT